MSKLIPFSFESKSIRVLSLGGAPWFVAKDVAEALEYSWKGKGTIGHVPEEWRGVCSVQTPSGIQEMATLSEPGLWFFVNRSDKPKALPFQKWVAGEVVPSIRQTGSYGTNPIRTPAPETVTLTKDEYIDLLKTQIAHLQATPPKTPVAHARPASPAQRTRRRFGPAEKAQIERWNDMGLTPTDMGRRMGRPASSVRAYLRRNQVAPEG